MERNFMQALENRRSHYNLTNESSISDDEIKKILEFALKNTPSAFNSQTTRIILLLGDNHKKLWEIVRETLRKVIPKDKFEPTNKKIDTFSNAYGSILFFEDMSSLESIKGADTYSDKFSDWSNHTSGMHQLVVWTMLEDAGMGASLQHYNSIIDEEVKETWKIQKDWKLIAQMPFGIAKDIPESKEKLVLDTTLKIFD